MRIRVPALAATTLGIAATTLGIAATTLGIAAGPAAAKPYLPPAGKIWNGVTGNVRPVTPYIQQTGKHPAVWRFFTNWGDSTSWWFPSAGATAGSSA